jgi:hypothetical protein
LGRLEQKDPKFEASLGYTELQTNLCYSETLLKGRREGRKEGGREKRKKDRGKERGRKEGRKEGGKEGGKGGREGLPPLTPSRSHTDWASFSLRVAPKSITIAGRMECADWLSLGHQPTPQDRMEWNPQTTWSNWRGKGGNGWRESKNSSFGFSHKILTLPILFLSTSSFTEGENLSQVPSNSDPWPSSFSMWSPWASGIAGACLMPSVEKEFPGKTLKPDLCQQTKIC